MNDALIQAVPMIQAKSGQVGSSRSLLVAVSGIDGSGKGYITARITGALRAQGVNAVSINLDPWHTPVATRLRQPNAAQNFYESAFRFDELFSLLIEPLRCNRSVSLSVELTRLPQNDWTMQTYGFNDVEVIVLEGIFLLKRQLRDRYDLAFWVDCSFQTALERAIGRNQEGLPAEKIVEDYQTIYFPAQRVHLFRDLPIASADGVIANDLRAGARTARREDSLAVNRGGRA
jgi:uridine kinase